MIGADREQVRAELGEFLKTRRARMHPSDVGLPDGGRRRTPGLRREELARLADVGVSWYTWLEQGRDIQVSAPLLDRLAGALRLSPAERVHLFELAQGRPPPTATSSMAEAGPLLQHVLDAYPYPAMASTPRRDVIAWNRAHAILYGDFGLLPPEERNMLWSMFLSPSMRRLLPEWELRARSAVARFRLEAARAADRSGFDDLAAAIAARSPEFAAFYRDHEVGEDHEGIKVLVHAEAGPITFEHVSLMRSEPDGRTLRVTFYSPAAEARARADRLFGIG